MIKNAFNAANLGILHEVKETPTVIDVSGIKGAERIDGQFNNDSPALNTMQLCR